MTIEGKDEEKEMDHDFKEVATTPESERNEIRRIQDHYIVLTLNEKWFVLDMKWFKKWKDWTSYDDNGFQLSASMSPRPEAIDNSHLLEEGTDYLLRRDLLQEEDYTLVPEKVWLTLVKWYSGGPAIPRLVIEEGHSYIQQKKIDLHPIFLRWGLADETQPDKLPREEDQTIEQLKRTMTIKRVIELFQRRNPEAIDSEVRLYMPLEIINKVSDKFPSITEEDKKRFIEITPEEHAYTLEEFEFPPNELHLLVAEKTGQTWPFDVPEPFTYKIGEIYDIRDTRKNYYEGFVRTKSQMTYTIHYINWAKKWDEVIEMDEVPKRFRKRGTFTDGPFIPRSQQKLAGAATFNNYSYGGYNTNERGKPSCKGVVGLMNLGNTCFMNSTLQCLMQSPWLTEFFLKQGWDKDVNRTNPLGKKGRVAVQYGALVKTVFSDQFRVVAPRELKRVIGEFAPRFMGFEQQDSQELLAFLLDGLHEDLNRIAEKPYTENVESNGREDNLVANETWETYKKRNDSVIVDLLQGQYKSRLVCPDCDRTSITFDPFMYLTVPLPTEKFKVQRVTFVPRDGTSPKKYGVKIPKDANIYAFKETFATQLGVDSLWLIVADIWKNKVHSIYRDIDSVQDLRETDDIWVYDSAPSESNTAQETAFSPMAVEGCGEKLAEPDEVKKTILQCAILHLAKPSYSLNTYFGIPLVTSLILTESLTFAAVHEHICKVLQKCIVESTTEEMDLSSDEIPFTISYKPINSYMTQTDLEPSDLKFDTSEKIKFYIHWKSPKFYNARKFVNCEKDISFPDPTSTSTNPVMLSSCLDAFTEAEILSQENAWYCRNCEKFQMASKKIDLWRLPDLLVIHLKRFFFTPHYRNKIKSLVEFPLKNLDFKKWIPSTCKLEQTTTYDLYGVSMHSGGLAGGHYTAYVQSLADGNWYNVDDSMTMKATSEATQTPAAYMLFYKRNQKSDGTS